MKEIRQVPYDFLLEDYEKYTNLKSQIISQEEEKKQAEIQAINEKYEASIKEKTAVYDKLIEACTYEQEFEVEQEIVEEIFTDCN
jgi:hypothetical protein